jgi:cytochrome c551/c552
MLEASGGAPFRALPERCCLADGLVQVLAAPGIPCAAASLQEANMRAFAIVALLAAGMLATAAAYADSGEELAKSSGCLGCHAVDTKKIGPAYKDVAKKFKGKPRAEVIAAMKAASVHSSVKVTDKDLSEIVEWIQKL